jgi:hypothetical protein
MATKGDISGLDVFMYGGVPLVPLVDSFTRVRKVGTITSDTQGGLSRQRKKFYNQPYLADVTYRLENVYMQDFMKVFFERNEGKKFVAYLSADRPITEPYVVQVVGEWSDPFSSAVDGDVTFTLEIQSVRDQDLDDYLFLMYQQYGDDFTEYWDGLKYIVKAMPEE